MVHEDYINAKATFLLNINLGSLAVAIVFIPSPSTNLLLRLLGLSLGRGSCDDTDALIVPVLVWLTESPLCAFHVQEYSLTRLICAPIRLAWYVTQHIRIEDPLSRWCKD